MLITRSRVTKKLRHHGKPSTGDSLKAATLELPLQFSATVVTSLSPKFGGPESSMFVFSPAMSFSLPPDAYEGTCHTTGTPSHPSLMVPSQCESHGMLKLGPPTQDRVPWNMSWRMWR